MRTVGTSLMVCAALTLPAWTGSAHAETAPAAASDTAKVTALATQFVTSHDPKSRCRMLERLNREGAFGGTARCVRGLADDDRSGFSTGAKVSSVSIESDGVHGHAVVTHVGGLLDGATGGWDFLKVGPEGPFGGELSTSGTWKIVNWGEDYLRSRTVKQLGARYVTAGPGDPLAGYKVRSCARTELGKLKEFDLFVTFTQHFRYDSDERFGRILGCVHKVAPKDIARLRRNYTFELVRLLTYNNYSAAKAKCAVSRTLKPMTDAALVAAAIDHKGGRKMTSRLVAEAKKC